LRPGTIFKLDLVGAARLVVAIHHTQSIDRILIKIGAESEASYDGPEEKDAAALQRPATRALVVGTNAKRPGIAAGPF
jgi:hypothetical protein